MSKVPPSPAQAMTVVSVSPVISRPALTPAAVEAAVSKAQWKMGTLSEEWGKGPSMTAQQQAGMQTIVFSPRALSTYLMAIVAPQPWQARCPGLISSSSGRVSFIVRSFFIS